MIITEFLKLPKYITYEGVEYTPIITHEGYKIYIVYQINSVNKTSPHYDDYEKFGCINFKGSNQSFLIVAQNIETESEFNEAIEFILGFLKINKLI